VQILRLEANGAIGNCAHFVVGPARGVLSAEHCSFGLEYTV